MQRRVARLEGARFPKRELQRLRLSCPRSREQQPEVATCSGCRSRCSGLPVLQFSKPGPKHQHRNGENEDRPEVHHESAQGLVRGWFADLISRTDVAHWGKDPKTELQERLQARKLPVPLYRIRATRGQAHAQTFEVECEVPAYGLMVAAEGRSKRVAEQEAARRMLDLIPETSSPSTRARDTA